MIDAGDDNLHDPALEAEETGSAGESGKGKSGKSGKSGSAGSTGGVRLPPNQLKEVTSNWEYLDASQVAARLADFFSELPARASAQVQVSWANLQNQGFAIITQVLKFAEEVSRLMMDLTRENAEILRHRYGVNVTTGPSG
jgi:hypothetical protein